MSTTTTETRPSQTASEHQDTAKRRQIMTGGREVFLAQGFEGASMGQIARTAGVSKGTLYVYFDSKERLFEAIFEEECLSQAEQVFTLDSADHDVGAVLRRVGADYIRFLCRPAALSALRTIIGIADRMPEVGKRFYEAGPAKGIATIARYLEDQVSAGILQVDDCAVTAAQFLETCQAGTFKPMLFHFADRPTDERIAHVVDIAVRAFLAAYRLR